MNHDPSRFGVVAGGHCACSSLARRFACSILSVAFMNALPFAAQLVQVVPQPAFYVRDLAARESVIFPKFDGPSWTVQIEHSLTAAPDYVHMGWPIIVRVDSHPHSAKPED